MEVSSSHQMLVFVLYLLSGIVCGMFFDVQRSIRKVLSAGRIRTLLEDLLFSCVCAGTAIIVAFLFNRGQMRYYQVMGFISGALFYAAFLSSFTSKMLIKLYSVLKKLVIKPVLSAVKIFMLPLVKMCLILKKICHKIKTYFIRFTRCLKGRKKKLKKRMKML